MCIRDRNSVDASSVKEAVEKTAKFVYGDKTYKQDSADGIDVVSVCLLYTSRCV